MSNVALPRNLVAEGDVVVLSRRDYERFIVAERRVKVKKTFIPTARDLAVLARGRKNFLAGRYRAV